MNIFNFEDYKAFIKEQIKINEMARGYKSLLASAAGCKLSYLSQVLKSHVELTPEHGLRLTQFWKLSKIERDYFLELIHLSRAGTLELKQLHLDRIESLRRESENLGAKYSKDQGLSFEMQAKYYSTWHYAAVHLGIMNPNFKDPAVLATKLGLSVINVNQYLEDLKNMGLLTRRGNSWSVTQNDIHLPKESPLTSQNHRNWRDLAVTNSLHNRELGSVQYTACYSLSEKAFSKIKQEMMALIDKSRAIAKDSADECLCGFNMDFFKLTK